MSQSTRAGSAGHTAGRPPYVLNLFAADFADGDEVDLGHQLPPNGLVEGGILEVVVEETTATTKTLSIGTLSSESGGDADGFDAAVDVSATGKTIIDGALVGTLLEAVTAKSLSATFGDAAGATELEAKLTLWIRHEPGAGGYEANVN